MEKKKKGHKRRRWILGGLAALLLGVWFIGPRLVAPMIQRKLQAMIEKHLHAQLTLDSLKYDFPYGVRAKNVALVTRDGQWASIDLVRIADLELVLAEMPWGNGPLVIERIIAKGPAVKVVQRDAGVIAGQGLVREEEKTPPAPDKPQKDKPSDYFRLRYLSIEDGRVVFEDQRVGQGQGDAVAKDRPPLIWSGINVEINARPGSGSEYSWEMTARNGPLGSANVRGKTDVDAATLDIEKFILTVKLEPGKKVEQLPAAAQEFLAQFAIDGSMTMSAQAHVPLKEISASSYEIGVDLAGASPKLGGFGGRIDRAAAKLKFVNTLSESAGHGVDISIGLIEVASGDTSLRIEKGEGSVDLSTQRWSAKDLVLKLDAGPNRSALPDKLAKLAEKIDLKGKLELTAAGSGPMRAAPDRPYLQQVEYDGIAYIRDATFKFSKFDKSFDKVSGTARINPKAIALEDVEGRYLEDQYFVTSARIPLENLANELQIRELTGSAQLSGRVDNYPHPYNDVVRSLHPAGTWYAGGNYTRKIHPRPDEKPIYWFDISADGHAWGAIGPRGIPLTDVKCELTLNTQGAEIRNLEGKCLGGQIKTEMKFAAGRPMAYVGEGWVRDLDLKALAQALAEPGNKPMRLSGRGNVNVKFEGKGTIAQPPATQPGPQPFPAPASATSRAAPSTPSPAAPTTAASDAWANLRAIGKFEVLEGDFWAAPVVEDVVGLTNTKPEVLTVGQARGDFEIRDNVVFLKDTTVNSPVLGIQGDGRIGLDGKLDLHAVAAPLADWKDQMKRTKIPILSDIAGELLGGLQKVLNSATRTLLYEVKITGTVKDRKVETVPAPVLTEGVAKWIKEAVK